MWAASSHWAWPERRLSVQCQRARVGGKGTRGKAPSRTDSRGLQLATACLVAAVSVVPPACRALHHVGVGRRGAQHTCILLHYLTFTLHCTPAHHCTTGTTHLYTTHQCSVVRTTAPTLPMQPMLQCPEGGLLLPGDVLDDVMIDVNTS